MEVAKRRDTFEVATFATPVMKDSSENILLSLKKNSKVVRGDEHARATLRAL